MLPGKMNLSREQNGLSYRLVEGEPDIVKVVWGQTVSVSADAVLELEDAEQRSERLEATDWLREFLSDGAVATEEIQKAAKAAGYAWRTVRRAKDALGIKPHKEGFDQGWSWKLPEDGHP
jgi:putative DNA primase/helicase